ncbi:MAG: 30S ribosomal protein S19 [bacterium]|nr:30S ribosomal protein S19 [bacterium]
MSRSLKKGPYIHPSIIRKLAKLRPGATAVIKTWARNSVITPEMIGITFQVHNGRIFIDVKAREEMVGHRLGEFSLTRKFVRHGGRMQKELEIKAAEGEKVKAAAPEVKPAK